MSAPRYEVVLFDLDDTLFAHRESVEKGITAHREALGGAIAAAPHANEFARWNALEELHYHRYLSGELDFMGQRRARARDFVAPFAGGSGLQSDADAEAWFDAYLVHYESTWMLHPDALPALDALAPARFGIITNGQLDFQMAKITAIGLEPRLEHIVASGEVGVAKPDPAIFLHACELFGVSPASAVYVGDRLHTDAIGARGAGLGGVWIDRAGSATAAQLAEAAAAGAPVIHSLAELPALLA